MHPILTEMRAQRRTRPIIAAPSAPVITDRREAWKKRRAWHQATGQTFPLKIIRG